MPTPNQIKSQIDRIVSFLIEKGLSADQNFAYRRAGSGNLVTITFEGADSISHGMGNTPYEEIYQLLIDARAFNVRMAAGGLLQMEYEFSGNTIRRHRLAFFSAPYNQEIQSSPEVQFEEQSIFTVLPPNLVPFPVRFDFAAESDPKEKTPHPKSHLTLGQYEDCRIPVSAPLNPNMFVDFILRNFYYNAFIPSEPSFPRSNARFLPTILDKEQQLLHLVIPN